jgi:signal peptidase II
LYFEPIFNKDYSWVNSLLQLGVGRWIHITVVALMVLLLFLIYSYLNHKKSAGKMINVMFTFLLAGALCSLIDKVFWDGSLDYIMLKGFFTFDLKDIYIDVSIGIIILSVITKNKELEKFGDKETVKDFVGYVKKDFLFGRRHRQS